MVSLNADQFGSLAHSLANDGGFTVHPHTGETPTSGHMVGRIHTEHEQHGLAGASDIEAYSRRHATTLAEPGTHLGGWHDRSSGKTYLDTSKLHPETELGHARAYTDMVSHRQKAMFTLSNFEETANPAGGFHDEPVLSYERRLKGHNTTYWPASS